jgi:hypothetical protein
MDDNYKKIKLIMIEKLAREMIGIVKSSIIKDTDCECKKKLWQEIECKLWNFVINKTLSERKRRLDLTGHFTKKSIIVIKTKKQREDLKNLLKENSNTFLAR